MEPGTTLRGLSRKLTGLGLVPHPYLFMTIAYLRDQATDIKAGEYELPPGIKPPELLALVTSGKVVQRAFTIVEGWTYRQLLAATARDKRIHNLLGDNPSAQEIMTRLGHPRKHPEGRFLPETYYFSKGASELDILRRAYETMAQVLQEEWARRDAELPLKSPYQALILASIVEKETGLATERPTIAGVFIRRLKLGMKLQTDPTVIYGLGARFDGDLTRAHLREDTPYNTYVHQGLPPRRSPCRAAPPSMASSTRKREKPSSSSPGETAATSFPTPWPNTTKPCAATNPAAAESPCQLVGWAKQASGKQVRSSG